MDEQLPPPAFAAGLCDRCVHAIVRPTRRDTTYLRCGLAGTDHRFPKYPQLPVRSCAGYDAAPA